MSCYRLFSNLFREDRHAVARILVTGKSTFMKERIFLVYFSHTVVLFNLMRKTAQTRIICYTDTRNI